MPQLDYYTSNPQDAVRLRMNSTPSESLPPTTIPELFECTVEQFPENPALAFRDSFGVLHTVTYRQYREKVHHFAKLFIKLGLQPHEIVSVLSFNCPEWFYSQFGSILAGGIIAGIYTTNSPEAVLHALTLSQSKILIVENDIQMKKIRAIWRKTPDLKTVVQINGPFESDLGVDDGYYKWSDFVSMDTSDLDEELQRRIDGIAANHCYCLIFTSGTIGFPKAAMISHDNMLWIVRLLIERFDNVTPGSESVLTYLPMCHVAAQLMDVIVPLYLGGCVNFSEPDTLKGSLVQTFSRIRPTRVITVPRVLEKFYEHFIKIESQLWPVQKALLNWARAVALEHHTNLMKGNPSESIQFKLAKYLVLNQIKETLGLDQIRTAVSGGAPVMPELKKFFLSLDILVPEAYGMTEIMLICLCDRNVTNIETSGKLLPGVEARIDNPDMDGCGELCVKGRSVFMGYLRNPEKIQKAFDDDGWFHTGDLARIDADGFVYITGRLKELIVTAGGANIPPGHVEKLIKNELPIVSNAVLVGDGKKYLTVLLTLKVEHDPDRGIPTDRLLPVVKEWLQSLSLSYDRVSEIIEAGPCPVVWKALADGIARSNMHSINNAQKVQKFAILPQDFSVATGELGPTLKLKRHFVMGKYSNVIESLYK